jgi:hypothetical protein
MLAFLMSKVSIERQLAANVFLSSRTWSHPHVGDFLNLAYGCSSFQMGWTSWGNCENIELLSELHPCWIGGKWQVIRESKGVAPCYLCFLALLLLPIFLLWCCGQKRTNLCEHSSLFFGSLLLWFGLSIIPYLKVKRLTNFTAAVNQEGTWMN